MTFPSRGPVYTKQQGDMKRSARRGEEKRGGEVEERVVFTIHQLK
jgi:hypothetical protein